MRKIFLSRSNGKEFHAGSKARNDAEAIMVKNGYLRRTVGCTSRITVLRRFINLICYHIFMNFERDSIVLNQYPYFSIQFYKLFFKRKKKKKFRVITLIHDLAARGEENILNNLELQDLVLKNSDLIICHNSFMKLYLEGKGISEDKLVCLEMFDYLCNTADKETISIDDFLYHIVIAGNLDPNKCKYIEKLGLIGSKLVFELYGVNYSGDVQKNVHYHGAFPPDELPAILSYAWGLVWDGSETETCAGKIGNYLRINNPHKVSLYIVSGIPVIIWKQAALAGFVEKYNIGITIESLNDMEKAIEKVSWEEYRAKLANIKKIGEKAAKGGFLTAAVAECEELLKRP